MPAISNQISGNEFNNIIKGQCTDTSLNTFQRFLNSLCDMLICKFIPRYLIDIENSAAPCIFIEKQKNHQLKNALLFKYLASNNRLKNIFNYLTSVIDHQASNITPAVVKQLLIICNNFYTIPVSNMDLTSIEINDNTQSFFYFFASVANLPETIRIQSDDNTDLKIFDLMHLSTGYFIRLSKFNGNDSLAIKSGNFPIYSPLISYFGGLGNLISNFINEHSDVDLNKLERNKVKIINSTIKIINLLKNDLTEEQISSARYTFLSKFHTVSDIQKACQDLFNTTHCHEFNPTNQTKIQDEIFTTENLNAVKNNTTKTLLQDGNTTIAPAFNQTISAVITDTAVDVTKESNSTNSALFNSGITLGSSAAHGAGSGMLNGIIQYFAAKHSQRGEPSSTTKAIIIYSSLLAHATLAATFPLMLYKIQEHINQGNENEAQQLWDNLLLQALPTFISSVGLSMGLQIVYEYTQLLSNRFRAIAQNTLPLAGTAVGLFKNPVVTGVQMAVSIAASSLTYGLFNWISPVNNNATFLDVEAKKNTDVELKPLNTENDDKPTANVIEESKDIGNIKKTYQYITSENFNAIKEKSQDVIKLLEELVSALNENIEKTRAQIDHDTIPDVAKMYQKIIDNKTKVLEIIQQELKIKSKISFLHDDHEKACQKYIIGSKHTETEEAEIKNAYISAMDKLGNVFKLLDPVFRNLELQLNKVKGYVEAAHASFANNDKTLDNLNDLLKALDTPFKDIKLYLNIYNTWNAGVQGKEEGVKEGAKIALANKALFDKIPQNAAPNTLRPKKTRSFLNTRPQSVASDSRTHSSGSEEGSVISTGSSKDEENALIVRPLLKSSR